jgi:serine protein kinase
MSTTPPTPSLTAAGTSGGSPAGTPAGPAVHDSLASLGDTIRDEFLRNRRVMSFAEYLDLVAQAPTRQLRASPQYVVDAMLHYGVEDAEYPWGKIRRFKLFDAPWAGGRDRLIGQETVQNQLFRILQNFVQDGAANKLVLLHGPNGSAKSTLIRCLGRALEDYSTLEDGALYRFNWIFPTQRSTRAGIGFGGADERADLGSTFAYLPDDLIDARVGDELRDHPLLLVPAPQRHELIARMLSAAPADSAARGFVVSDYIRHGALSHKNRQVFEALLASYQGDYVKVLRHVQVERFYIQHRYRTGWVTVEPQMSVDASERQITADRSLAALPPSLQSVALHEYGGEIVGANRGMIEYDDLLKRPLETYKYLLTTVERGSVSLSSANLFLDITMIGSSNEIHLAAFKEIPDFQSFKGRIELVRVPYILDVTHEKALYDEKLLEAAGGRHVAPHSAYVAALWAVLTRMRKPQVDRYPAPVSELVAKLTPIEKAELYAYGQAPSALPPSQQKELSARVKDLVTESDTYPNYEGRIGASPREMQGVLLNAANSPRYPYVSPLIVLDEIAELCKQTSLYEFLKQDVQPGGFHDHRRFIEQVRERMYDRIDDEVRTALGLVEESEYARVFERYLNHVTHWVKKEKVRNPMSGRMEDPDEPFMREVEKTLEVPGKSEDFRGSLIAKIGAWSLDHRGEKPVYGQIFGDLMKKLKDAYYERHKKAIAKGVGALVGVLTGNEGGYDPEALAQARRAQEQLTTVFGYSPESARDLVGLMAKQRYRL